MTGMSVGGIGGGPFALRQATGHPFQTTSSPHAIVDSGMESAY